MLRRIEPRFKEWARLIARVMASSAIVLLITLAFLAIVEGVASVALVMRGRARGDLLERTHTEFDRELGWINRASIRIDDLYGPGLYLETNSQRFRHRRDFERIVPKGKVRAVCTGDSFTLGYGVKNDDAWCELLVHKDLRLETVNMGQGGYGVDQAYLWYRRGGLTLDHDVLIFGFAATDFVRMMSSTFSGYPKPVLEVKDGKPVVVHDSSWLRFVARGLSVRVERLARLRFIEWWRSGRSSAEVPAYADARVMNADEGRTLALAMFDELGRLRAAHGKSLLLVLLPTNEDYGPSMADEWRNFLRDELAIRKIPFLDLVGALRDQPEGTALRLFRGHYNEAGNRWVADRLHAALVELPHVRERLQEIGAPPQPLLPLMPEDARLPLERIPLGEATIRASAMEDSARLALDGSVSTRWNSGAAQNGREEIVLDLGVLRSLRQVKLDLGGWGYDYGRGLALDVAEAETHYREVLRVEGNAVRVDNLDHAGESQLLVLSESVKARYVRIRQLARADENFWSVAEIQVFDER